MYAFDEIKKADSEIADAIQAEMERQNSHLELIASENWVSKAVMAAMGSPLTNKYAEGYPGKRYYGGCQCVDVVEDLARERAKKLFGCDYANVQPHSGAQANLAVFFAMLEPGDKVMGMNLDHGVKIISGGTDNHLMLIDLRGEEVTGKELEKRLDAAHITCNKNTVPNDPRSPFVTSGVRLGTPAVTTRGLKEDDMDVIAECIALVLQNEDNIEKVKGMVTELTAKYPLDM